MQTWRSGLLSMRRDHPSLDPRTRVSVLKGPFFPFIPHRDDFKNYTSLSLANTRFDINNRLLNHHHQFVPAQTDNHHTMRRPRSFRPPRQALLAAAAGDTRT